jgi:putative ABC transport system permease protein
MQDRIFGALLRLLPAELRGEYGREMSATFRAERSEARGAGRVALWAGTLGDLLRTAPVEHWDILRRDLGFAWRTLRGRPAPFAAAVASLGLAIGGNVAMFSIADAVLFAPLGYADVDRVVLVQEQKAGREPGNMGFLTFSDVRSRSRSFTALAAASQSFAVLEGDGRDPERVAAVRASATYFDVVGVQPALGRAFTAAEDRPGSARRVAILSDRLWRRRFAADPSVVGRTVSASGIPLTVVGVMPASFDDLVASRLYEGAEMWTPLGYDPAASFACRTCRHLRVFGRLAPGVTTAQAEGEVAGILGALAIEHPASYDRPGARVTKVRDVFLGAVRPVLGALGAGVFLFLLAACANVANLLLLRASERGTELSVRAALGVTRPRLVRQLLTEAAVLAGLSGALGTAVAWVAVRVSVAVGPAEWPRLAAATVDLRALAVAAALTTATSVVFGLLPLRHLREGDLVGALRGAGRLTETGSAWRTRAVLVATSVALAAVLLTGAALLARSLYQLLEVAPGFDTRGVLVADIELNRVRYDAPTDPEAVARAVAFYDELTARIRALPGVTAASAVSTLPLGGNRDGYGLHVVGRPLPNPEAAPSADRFVVRPGFFETLAVPLLRGRGLDERDAQGAPLAVVVNRHLADAIFPGEDALGRPLALGPPDAPPRTIVGVVGDIRHAGLDVAPAYQVYVPQAQWAWAEPHLTLLVKTPRPYPGLPAAVREAVRAVEPAQPAPATEWYAEVVGRTTATRRYAAGLLAAFSATALLLAVAGVHGALALLVRQKHREIGIRMAVGAAGSDIVAMIARRGLVPAGLGLGAGLLVAFASAELLASLLYGVTARDPATFAMSAAVLGSSALLAALAPAWRAARVAPASVLRSD